MADLTGQNLGNYRLVRLLGSGGFAEVYLGEHLRLGTPAAIKILYAHIKGSEANDFLAEARTIARLDHPSIVRILDYDVQDGTPFFVMAYAPNGNLRIRHPKESRLPLPLINNYLQQVAEALQYAHDRKIIHRDIKPENMLVGARNEILLSDFGLALIEQSSRMQSTQAILGTALYMSPEQLQGKPRLASDQYSLGIVVYEWLCGERPFHGTFMELYSQHISVQPPSLRTRLLNLPPAIEDVVMTALAKDPNQRFANIQAFATMFEQAMNQSLSTSRPPRPPRPLHPSYPSQSLQPPPAQFSPTPSGTLPTHPTPSTPAARNTPATPGTPSQPSPAVGASGTDRILPGGARPVPPVTGKQAPPRPEPPVTTESLSDRQSEPLVPFYRVEDMVANEPERKRGLGRREFIVGAGVATLLAASAWFLLKPRSRPDIPQGTLIYTYRGHSASVLTLAWSPDGTRIASADTTVQVWDAAKGHTIYIYKGHSGSVNAVAWSPGNKRIASAGDDTTVQVWNASDGGKPYIYKSHSASVATIAWSPDGTRIASGSSDNTVRVWNASDGGAPYVYKGHTYHVNTVAWSPDGKLIASGGGDNTVQVWNADGGIANFTYRGHSGPVQDLAWSPDGTRIASAGDDMSVQIWNASDGTTLYIYRGHSASVTTVAWSPDGKQIVSGSSDRTVQIWNAQDGSSAYIYKGHSEVVNDAAWSPNGTRIASASNDYTAQIWYAQARPA